jgi:hypothetical protein
MVALLSGVYRNSQRMVQSALADLFGISMSLGTVNTLRIEASDALANCVAQAKLYVQQQPVVGADETSFAQGNIDGCNPKQRQVAAVSPGFSKSREKPQRAVGCSHTTSYIF